MSCVSILTSMLYVPEQIQSLVPGEKKKLGLACMCVHVYLHVCRFISVNAYISNV